MDRCPVSIDITVNAEFQSLGREASHNTFKHAVGHATDTYNAKLVSEGGWREVNNGEARRECQWGESGASSGPAPVIWGMDALETMKREMSD